MGFFSNVTPISTIEAIETTIIQYGDDPDGNWDCARYEFDDGSDCTVVDVEGADGGIQFFGDDR